MKKQFTFILALAMLMIMLAGCSGNTSPGTSGVSSTGTSAVTDDSLRRLQLILRWRTLENTWSSSPTAGLP